MDTELEVVVIGAGQAGLSTAYHLRRSGLPPETEFVVLDHAPSPGGAWQFRWPSLTLQTVNGVHDLPGMAFAETLGPDTDTVQTADAVPHYYGPGIAPRGGTERSRGRPAPSWPSTVPRRRWRSSGR